MRPIEDSGFFHAKQTEQGYDREYNAGQFAKYFSMFIGDGVHWNPANQLEAVYVEHAESPFTVMIRKGKAYIQGYWYELKEDLKLELNPNKTPFDTRTLISCTLDKINREVTITVKENQKGLSVRDNESYKDLLLTEIVLHPQGASIKAGDIHDIRANEEYCGFIRAFNEQLDTKELFLEYERAFKAFLQASEQKWETSQTRNESQWTESQKQHEKSWEDTQNQKSTSFQEFINKSMKEFNEWFASVKEVVDSNAIGKLQNQIGTLSQLKTTSKDNLVKAINEMYDHTPTDIEDKLKTIGNVSELKTKAKDNIVHAVNEVNEKGINMKDVVSALYPVGSVYISSDNTFDPNEDKVLGLVKWKDMAERIQEYSDVFTNFSGSDMTGNIAPYILPYINCNKSSINVNRDVLREYLRPVVEHKGDLDFEKHSAIKEESIDANILGCVPLYSYKHNRYYTKAESKSSTVTTPVETTKEDSSGDGYRNGSMLFENGGSTIFHFVEPFPHEHKLETSDRYELGLYKAHVKMDNGQEGAIAWGTSKSGKFSMTLGIGAGERPNVDLLKGAKLLNTLETGNNGDGTSIIPRQVRSDKPVNIDNYKEEYSNYPLGVTFNYWVRVKDNGEYWDKEENFEEIES